MSQKFYITLGTLIGSTLGGYMPLLFGVSAFSFTSILTGGIGAIIGIWIGYRISQI